MPDQHSGSAVHIAVVEEHFGVCRPLAFDEATFDIAADLTPRTVEVPDDLAVALAADPAVERPSDAMAYSHRHEYVRWVTEAKREQTRLDRIAKTVEKVREGKTR